MIGKNELTTILEQALIAEEKAIPIYMKHLKTAVLWTGISEEDVEGIRKTMKVLLDESEGHKRVVLEVLDSIKERGQDAY
jgi:rubrerythrin